MFCSYTLLLRLLRTGYFRLFLIVLPLGSSFPSAGQSLRKLERGAINRTHLTFVTGDTVQRFTITSAHPTPQPGRFYYWKGPTQILRTAGAYDGKLLTGAYQLTSRNGNLLGSGTFKNGRKTGLWQTWRADGTPLTRSQWRQGKQRGKMQAYDEAGQLRKPVVPLKSPAGTSAGPVRVWQLAYWKGVVKRVKMPRWAKRKRQPAVPVMPPAGTLPSSPTPVPSPALPQQSGS